MKLFVYDQHGNFVAQITKQHKLAMDYRPDEPWLLLYKNGRIERFEAQGEAKTEARKTWSNSRFAKN